MGLNTAFDDPMLVIVHPTTNLEVLEDEWNRYQSLPIQLMQHSDDAAIRKYGYTNRTIYEKMKAYILLSQDEENDNDLSDIDDADVIISEDFNMTDIKPIDHIIDNEDEALLKNINFAKSINTDTMVVIYPYTLSNPYTIEDLNAMFNRYNMLSQDLKRLSDQECMRLFNKNNINMYNIEKNKLLSLIDQAPDIYDDIILGESDNSIANYFSIAENTSGLLRLLERKFELTYLKNNGTITESTFAEDSLARIDDSINKEREISDAVPEFVPFFVPTEIEELLGDNITPADKEFIDKLNIEAATGFKGFDFKKYYKSLKDIAAKNESQAYTIDMIRNGWNPNVPLNEKGFVFARNRMIKYLNEYYRINIVDLRNRNIYSKIALPLDEGKTNIIDFVLKPVFLVCGKDVAYITTDAELTWLYSDQDPLSLVLVSGDAYFDVYCTFVDDSTFVELKKGLAKNKNNIDIFNSINNSIRDTKRLCSAFVNAISQLSNAEKVNDPKVYYIFSGEKIKYTADRIIPTLKVILSDKIGLTIRKLSAEEAMRKMDDDPSVVNYKTINCNEAELDNILKDINYLCNATSVVTEAKRLPFRISNKGIFIDLPTKVEEDYQMLHKSLLAYEAEKNYEAMKDDVAHLWYLNLLCERKIGKLKDKDNKAGKLKVSRDVRARILNDFKKYLKMIVANDKEFDFTSYFAKSKYNDKTIFVDKDTLKYTGKVVATVVKSLIKSQQK